MGSFTRHLISQCLSIPCTLTRSRHSAPLHHDILIHWHTNHRHTLRDTYTRLHFRYVQSKKTLRYIWQKKNHFYPNNRLEDCSVCSLSHLLTCAVWSHKHCSCTCNQRRTAMQWINSPPLSPLYFHPQSKSSTFQL